jgi:hypothetical protein
MSPLLAVVLIGGVILWTVRSARDRRGDHHSLAAHHRALIALGEIARQDDQPPPTADLPPVRPHLPVESANGRPSKGVGQRVRQPAHRPLTPPPHPTLVPDPVELVEPPAPPPRGTTRGTRRQGGQGTRRPSNRSRYVWLGGAAVVVATVGLVGLDRWGQHHRSRLSVPASRPAASLPTPPSPQPTTTTPAAAPVLISSDRRGGRYLVSHSAEIELATTSPCWVQVRAGTVAGPILFQGVLPPDDRRRLPSGRRLWLRLGNPAGVAVVVNSNTLHLAGSRPGQPYNLELQPAA